MSSAELDNDAFARTFTRAMDQVGREPASAWPELLDLSGYTMMLDIGGGSGVHALAAARRWPRLQVVLIDRPAVCQVARANITGQAMEHRIQVQAGDIWRDPYPPADLHLYSWVYYALPGAKRRLLSRKSFDSLPPDGRIILHEMLYQEVDGAPLAGSPALAELLSAEGQRYRAALIRSLGEAGFGQIEVIPSLAPWCVITGSKRP